jgi:SAM-dependent methyltransferase
VVEEQRLTLEELRRISKQVGERRGWDFSRVRDALDPVPWDYGEVVRRYLKPTDRVLDVGTGGGERFLALAADFGTGVGIDSDAAMVQTARENRPASLAARVSFRLMDAAELGLLDASFDVVLNRHSEIYPNEITRVLRADGTFITQQVGRQNTLNLLAAFGWGPESFGEGWGQEMHVLCRQFQQMGCSIVARGEYDVRYWFLDVESFVFWLKAAPLPEEFDMEKHWRSVDRALEAYRTPKGIETNEHRELLIVQKRSTRWTSSR